MQVKLFWSWKMHTFPSHSIRCSPAPCSRMALTLCTNQAVYAKSLKPHSWLQKEKEKERKAISFCNLSNILLFYLLPSWHFTSWFLSPLRCSSEDNWCISITSHSVLNHWSILCSLSSIRLMCCAWTAEILSSAHSDRMNVHFQNTNCPLRAAS